MNCVVNDGKEAITIKNIDRYCYEHYQVYDSLQKLYQQVSISSGPLPWEQYLTKVLDANFNASWKTSLIDPSTGRMLDLVATVARVELKQ
jgi:hypothetical protein